MISRKSAPNGSCPLTALVETRPFNSSEDIPESRALKRCASTTTGLHPLEILNKQYVHRIHLRRAPMSLYSNPHQIQEAQALVTHAEQQMSTALNDMDGAIRFILEGEKTHPNRHDVCARFSASSQPPSSSGTAFGQGPTSAPSTVAFAQPSSASAGTAFGQPTRLGGAGSAFGQPSQLGGASAFGKPSQLGGSAPAFGQAPQLGGTSSAFGKPSQLGGATSAFGQPSQLAGNPPAQPSAFGQASSFGKPSALGQASSFGQPSTLGHGSSFGQPSGLGQATSAFGQPSQLGGTAPASNAPAFGVNSQAPNSVFGQPSQPPATTLFGQGTQEITNNPSFGQTTAMPTANAFGKPSVPAASPFNAATTAPTQGPAPFGQPQAKISNPFAAAGQSTTAQPVVNPFDANPPPKTDSFASLGQTNGAVSQPGNATNPYSSDAKLNHPDLQTYSARDGSNKVLSWKSKPVQYVDGEPCLMRADDGKWEKIWFPDGPPPYNEDTELPLEMYDDKTKEAYLFMRDHGVFKDGWMPYLPPRREWCTWDF